jgi:hypothetical protein
MQKIRTIEGAGYSLCTSSLDMRPKRMFVAILSYGLSDQGGPKDVEVPFTL